MYRVLVLNFCGSAGGTPGLLSIKRLYVLDFNLSNFYRNMKSWLAQNGSIQPMFNVALK